MTDASTLREELVAEHERFGSFGNVMAQTELLNVIPITWRRSSQRQACWCAYGGNNVYSRQVSESQTAHQKHRILQKAWSALHGYENALAVDREWCLMMRNGQEGIRRPNVRRSAVLDFATDRT